jgi:hypothetical protein
MTEEREEKEVSAVFLKTVDEFCKDSDAIFKEFDVIRESYVKGEDIMDALRDFRLARASIFLLIDAIFHKEVELEHKLNKAEIAEEKREKILEFKNRFADLAESIDLFVMQEIGVGQW